MLGDRLRRWADQAFGIDLRSLGLFRIALGLVCAGDVVLRARDLRAHYTDVGVLPRAVFIDKFMDSGEWSFHLATGEVGGVVLLFVLHALVALLVALGWRSRLMTFLLWAFTCSLQTRNPVILHGGDTVMRVVLFFAMFVPLGARFSVDHALDPDRDDLPDRVVSLGTAALLLQVCAVYWFCAVLKHHPVWTTEGTAVYYALSIDQFVTPFGRWLLGFPALLKVATYGTVWYEILGPLVALLPVWQLRARALVAVGFMVFHMLLLGPAIRLGMFTWFMAVSWIPFLPAICWEWAGRRARTEERLGLAVAYDGDCGFCEKTLLILRSLLMLPETAIAPAQDDEELAPVLRDEQSWIVTDHLGARHLRFDALCTFLSCSPIAFWIVPILRLPPVSAGGDRVYRWVARHRPRLSRLTAHLRYRRVRVRGSRVGSALVIVGVLAALAWNVRTLRFSKWVKYFPRKYNALVYVIGLEQYWNLFAPYPMKDDGWYVVPGKLKNGSKVDAWRGLHGEPTFDKPALVSEMYPNQRWSKYMMNLWKKKHSKHRLHFGRWMCRQWNRDHTGDEQLDTFHLWFVKELTPPPGGVATPKKVRIWRHYCFDRPKDWKKDDSRRGGDDTL